ncbi:MAG: DHH family phosphoesterase [Methanohalobium sp.]|uniref:DHH family phosphoesterase n=1 Tax=Methanohalobium sp. TaxID=2837493 RepID=UPI00397D3FD8
MIDQKNKFKILEKLCYFTILKKYSGFDNILPSSDNGLLIHHWDTDGICSAAILFEDLEKEFDTHVPHIGNYFLTGYEIENISKQNYDFIIIADMALPEDNILDLKEKTDAEIYIFDHHLQNNIQRDGIHHHNPVSLGEPPESYPSNTWVLTRYLDREIDLFSILGAVGDREKKIKDNVGIYQYIKAFLEDSDFYFEDLLRVVELIDSNYKVGDKQKVMNAVHFIKENKLHPQRILDNSDWKKNLDDLEMETERQKNMPVDYEDGIAIQEIDTRYNITSPVARNLAWNGDCRVAIVVNRGFFDDKDQLYVRAGQSGPVMTSIIDAAQEKGYSAGGKNEVAGIVLPKGDTDYFIKEVLNLLQV